MSGFLERMLGNLMGGRLGGHGGGYQGGYQGYPQGTGPGGGNPGKSAAPMRTAHALPAVRRVLQRGQEFIDLSLRRRPGGLLELYLKQG